MAATQKGTAPSHKQTAIRLRVELFDKLMAKQGITSTSVRVQARAVGVGKTTMSRLRAGNGCGTNRVAIRIADACGTTVEKLFERIEVA